MDVKPTIYIVNMDQYQNKLKECRACLYNTQCRGPTPIDPDCPKKFKELKSNE